MPRDEPLDPPSIEAAVAAAEVALDRGVVGAARIEEGLNAVYRIDLGDGSRAVLKAATLATDAELLPEPRLLSRLGRETAVPVPDVLATTPPDEGPLGVAYFVTAYCEGRHVTDVLTLPPTAHERLVREAGRHLAAMHEVRVADGFGNLRVDDDLAVTPKYESWATWFAELVTDAADGLLGEGYVTDAEARFADLEPGVREALTGLEAAVGERPVAPAVLHGDYRPANLVLAPRDDADPITRAVLDFGNCPTGDGLVDVALAEDVLIDVPLGGTERADRLRRVLRTAYVDGRDAGCDALFDDRYPYYRLYARVRRLASFGYMVQFAREDDPDDVARRWRSFVRERLAEIE